MHWARGARELQPCAFARWLFSHFFERYAIAEPCSKNRLQVIRRSSLRLAAHGGIARRGRQGIGCRLRVLGLGLLRLGLPLFGLWLRLRLRLLLCLSLLRLRARRTTFAIRHGVVPRRNVVRKRGFIIVGNHVVIGNDIIVSRLWGSLEAGRASG